jgi:hypothetical protein
MGFAIRLVQDVEAIWVKNAIAAGNKVELDKKP